MKMPVVIVDGEKEGGLKLGSFLTGRGYQTAVLVDLVEFGRLDERRAVVVLDLDTVEVSEATFRDIKQDFPGLVILALSERPFHPELAESMKRHIYACLAKPVDGDELDFWLKTIRETEDD